MPSVKVKRGTRAQLNTAASASGLAAGEPYLITDEERLAVGTAANAFVDFAKKSEVDSKVAAASGTATGLIITGTRETRVAVAASAIDLSAGNLFTRTISDTTTFTVSNVPASGTAVSFILELTNGGSATVNWWSGMKWAGGTAPALTASGVDVLGFYSHDGGTTWRGFLLAKDSK